ncbi:MAG: hypothetical protein JO307_11115 [Bryobacterales bacterium]|nr:hypothetical protein [Bryobacterales bacterium]MBV9397639.1 hypothetical protein [Bryobacterales bacterium]
MLLPISAAEMVAVAGTPLALIVTETGPEYPVRAVTLKVPEVAPPVTVVDAGADNFALLLKTARLSPPAGAGPASAKLHVLVWPAFKVAGTQLNDFGGTMPIVKLAD